jgi:hypothetical protein
MTNTRSLLTALSLAFAGTAAMATEATEFPVPPSTLTRAQVQEELLAATTLDKQTVSRGEATVFVDKPTTARTRAEVRDEARAHAHDLSFNDLYAG